MWARFQNGWRGFSYQWNEDQSDAILVAELLNALEFTLGVNLLLQELDKRPVSQVIMQVLAWVREFGPGWAPSSGRRTVSKALPSERGQGVRFQMTNAMHARNAMRVRIE